MIRVYNTLSRSKEPFETVRPGKVGIYLCGPTVYKPSHIGHMVGPVIFDTIKRYLSYNGYEVTFVINITDVDDKLIVRSSERGVPMSELAAEMTADYKKCLATMGVDGVDLFPTATENMDRIIQFTSALVDKGFAYESQGDVYFDVSKCADYGKLSGRSPDSMQGEGGETAARKRSAADFALWKRAKQGEPAWESPWGPGRPGWHIECSAMSGRFLGETFDIHGGGLDLVFPHHENEVAQSECLHAAPMAKYWMHNGLMQDSSQGGKLGGRQTRPEVGDQQAQTAGKLAGSAGAQSFLQLLEETGFHAEQIRFFLLSTHYRRPIDYSLQRIRQVGTGLETFYRFFKRYERIAETTFYDLKAPTKRVDGRIDSRDERLLDDVNTLRGRFLDAMDDDFNTGGATGVLFDLVRRLNKFADDEKLENPAGSHASKLALLTQGVITLKELANILGLFRQAPPEAATGGDELTGKLLDLLVRIRADRRKAKDFATADHVRHALAELGVLIEDRPGGTEWTIQ